jgi:metal-sulfur cluster biosynthetic enzyme
LLQGRDESRLRNRAGGSKTRPYELTHQKWKTIINNSGANMVTREQVNEVLKKCYDPEIPVNVLDLGLIYDVDMEEERVNVKMTLTAPGCGMGPMIAEDVRSKLMGLPGIKEAKVELTFDPPWNPEMMSEDAKRQLGWE